MVGRAVLRNVVERKIGQIAQGEGTRVDSVTLTAPFIGQRFGKRAIGHNLRVAGLRKDRAVVEEDLPAGSRRIGRYLPVEAFHFLRRELHRRASSVGARKAAAAPANANAAPTRSGQASAPARTATPPSNAAIPARRTSWMSAKRRPCALLFHIGGHASSATSSAGVAATACAPAARNSCGW